MYIIFITHVNSLDEQFNATLQNMLVKFTCNKKELWDKLLDTCIYAFNTSIHESTTYSPFELMFGQRAFLPIDIELNTKDPDLLIKEYCSSKEDDTNIVRLITQQCLEKLEAAKNTY